MNIYDTLRKGSLDAGSVHVSVCRFLRADSHRLRNMCLCITETHIYCLCEEILGQKEYHIDFGTMGHLVSITTADHNSKCLVSTG